MARQAFDDAISGEQTAALPALALPLAASAATQTAARAAPEVAKQIARFAANDPRFAQIVASNPYVQQVGTTELIFDNIFRLGLTAGGDIRIGSFQYWKGGNYDANKWNEVHNYQMLNKWS